MAETKLTRNQALNKATGAANRRLKAKYEKEWNAFMVEETASLGEKWAPKPTEEERAAAEFALLLKQYPHLAEQVAADLNPTPAQNQVEDSAEGPA